MKAWATEKLLEALEQLSKTHSNLRGGHIKNLRNDFYGNLPLVLKAQFLAGNDVFTLYTNPAPGAPEPTSGVVKTDLDLGVVSTVGIYSTGAFTID